MKKILLSIVAVFALGAAGMMLFAWSGIYNVAASRGHLLIAHWVLDFGMRNSVELHSRGIAPSSLTALDDPALFERGIGHFQGGCAPCHGAPGFPANPIAQQMLPSAPDLSKLASRWTPGELFWIIRHGLKYTGMPAWPVPARDDEIWAVVAVVLRLPEIDADTYTRLALASYVSAAGPEDRVLAGFLEGDPIACVRCHGTPRAGGSAGGVPKLAGQKPEYLEMTLRDYEFGTRPSGIMHPVAIYLTKDDRQQLARYYASLATPELMVRPSAAVAALSDGTAARTGGMLAAFGAPVRGIPACSACHGEHGRAEGMDARFPALAGQHFGYLVNQLELWRAGIRGGTFDKLMSAAARHLTDDDIKAVAAYYSSLGRNSN